MTGDDDGTSANSSPDPPRPPDVPRRSRSRGLAMVGGLVLAALVAVIVVVAIRSGEHNDRTAAGSANTDGTVQATTTSTSTTTRPATTTTSTTTTLPRPIGAIALIESGLVIDFGSPNGRSVLCGDDADITTARLRAALGTPTTDTGWRKDNECEGQEARRVRWGDLEVVFTRTGDQKRDETFQQWYVGAPGRQPAGLVTFNRVGIGSLVADLEQLYPEGHLSQPVPGDPTGLFTTKSEGDDIITGTTTNTTDLGVVAQLWAGYACQRVTA
jgi:hypothetical protein